MRRTLCVVTAAVLCTGCLRQVDVVGGSSEWSLVEDLVLGTLTGSEGIAFGEISELADTPAGGVVVVDIIGPRLLYFGAEGDLIGHIGRQGQGPGEYTDISGIATLPDGTIVVRDPRRAITLHKRRDLR